MAKDHSVPLEDVLAEELVEIKKVRKKRWTTEHKGRSRHQPRAFDALHDGNTRDSESSPPMDSARWDKAISDAHAENLTGLAFSGGGIRSATFNLGVLQALAELNLLNRIDYLSTVSGGGYIGAWLVAWTKRLKSFAEVQKRLVTSRVNQIADNEPTPIRFLRVFSNYLTPKLGIFSGDTWAMVAIYLRNVLLNQVIVLAALTAALLVPRLFEKWALELECFPRYEPYWFYAGAFLLVLAFLVILNNMAYLDCRDQGGARQLTKQGWVLALTAAPLFAVAVLGGLWQVARLDGSLPYGQSAFYGGAAYGAIWIVASVAGSAYRLWFAEPVSKFAARVAEWSGQQRIQRMAPPAPENMKAGSKFASRLRKTKDFVISLIAAICAGALAGWLYALLSAQSLSWTVHGALTFGAPLVLAIFLLAATLQIGLMGIVFHDRSREWWGRLGGWLLLWGIVWVVVFWVALYFPGFIHDDKTVAAARRAIAAKYLTPAWILTTAGSVFAGKSKATGEPGTLTWKDGVAKVGPYVFIAGLLCWLSYGIAQVQKLNLFSEYQNQTDVHLWVTSSSLWAFLNTWSERLSAVAGSLLVSMSVHRLWWAILLCIAVALVMAWRVDVNQFSMHLFYRNRLVRCYLGASNEKRSPNRFTGFDGADDMPLKDLRLDADIPYDGPYPVLNMSLNLVRGEDLAWQERMAESFVMTPRYCGFDVWLEEQDSPIMRQQRPLTQQDMNKRQAKEAHSPFRNFMRRLDRYGYRPTEEYAFPPPFTGPNLGLAMGISGAAASPSMGSYTSAPVGFLMTLFDVRLGQWLGNPRSRRTWQSPTPALGLVYLLNELFGGTNDEAAYVYLSDGGHFENLALYELVKRRCGLIIVCDAEADDCYGFTGLGNAIRKCRIDLGIDIDLDVTDITPAEPGKPSKKHCAVGDIHYETVDVDAPTGTIIYFKASLTGDESTDVVEYKKGHKTFPHETTEDQWFSESQFESYRELGYHEVMTALKAHGAPGTSTALSAAAKSATVAAATANQAAAAAMTEAADQLCDAESAPDADQGHKKKAADSKDTATAEGLRTELHKFGFDTSKLTAKH